MANKLLLLFLVAFGWILQGAAADPIPHTAPAPAQTIAHGSGLLWKVERPGAPPSYLFGTMHSEDARVTRLPAPVRAALDRARSFTMEMLLEPEASAVLASAMFLGDGQDLRGILGDELFDKTADALERYGMPRQIAMALKPWAATVMLSMPKPTTGRFLDKALYETALAQGKPAYGLESVDEQVAVFEGLPLADQVTLLEAAMEDSPAHRIEELTRAYLARDLAAMMALNDQSSAQLDPALSEKVMRRLLDDRNLRMVERMEARLREGNAFIAVGALHLPGEKGVLRLLEGRGYRVTVVY